MGIALFNVYKTDFTLKDRIIESVVEKDQIPKNTIFGKLKNFLGKNLFPKYLTLTKCTSKRLYAIQFFLGL